MSTSRTDGATRANRQATDARIDRIEIVLARMERDGTPIVKADVADKSGVSRAFLYQNHDARERVEAAIERSAGALVAAQDRQGEENLRTWRERALNAESEAKRAHEEIVVQRRRLGELLGQIRTLEEALPADSTQLVRTENLTLKRRQNELEAAVRDLGEQLAAARENNRFFDKKVGALQMELVALRGDG